MRDELHYLVEYLSEERLEPVLRLIRGDAEAEGRARAVATVEHAQERLRGVAGVAGTGVFLRWFVD
jgi:hypothetical protein